MAQERVVEWIGEEESFPNRSRLTTIGNTLIYKHLLSTYGITYYAKDRLNKRQSQNASIYMYKPTDNVITFYHISFRVIEKNETNYRIRYNLKVDTNYKLIIERCGEVGEEYVEDLMIKTGNPEWIELVRVRREAKEEYLIEINRLNREQAREQAEEDHNDILERAQTELRREREMMAEFVEVFAPEPAIVPYLGSQLDLVSTPVPFVPEQPPNG